MTAGHRTEPPTRRRVQQARRAGHVPFSPSVVRAACWLALLVTLPWTAERLIEAGAEGWRVALASDVPAAEQGATALRGMLHALAPVLYATFAVAWLAGLVQTRGLFFDRRKDFAPPGRGSRAGRAALALGFSALTLMLGLAIALYYLPSVANGLLQPAASAGLLLDLGYRCLAGATGVCLVAAGVDWLWARRAWWLSLHTTRAELARELREQYGSTHLKRSRTQLHGDLGER